eukprot:2524587-Pleurochrysis_carterae.AAC.1
MKKARVRRPGLTTCVARDLGQLASCALMRRPAMAARERDAHHHGAHDIAERRHALRLCFSPAHHPQGGDLDKCQVRPGGGVAYTSHEGQAGVLRVHTSATVSSYRVAETDKTYQPAGERR